MVPSSPSSRCCSKLSAHSNMEMDAGFDFPFLLDGFAGSSAMNSPQENSNHPIKLTKPSLGVVS